MSDEAAAIADEVLTRFNQATRARDLDVSLAVLTDDPTVYGSGSGETAIGRAAVTAFLTDIYSRPFTYGWEWQVEHAERSGDVIWFVAPSEAALEGDDGREKRLPYRIAGTLVLVRGEWRIALFNGSEPADD